MAVSNVQSDFIHVTSDTNVSVPFGVTATEGNILVAVVALGRVSAGSETMTAPSGWTAGPGFVDGTLNGGVSCAATAWKVYDGTEDAAAFTYSNAFGQASVA